MDRSLRLPFRLAHQLLKLHWFLRRPRTFGAHGLALTPDGKAILVKLRYAPGWRLPGGGRSESEHPREAMLRELREEIGMTSHGAVRDGCELDEPADFKRDCASLFIVEDVRYRPHKWSWEIEAVGEFALDRMPADLSPRAAGWLEALRDKV